MNNKEGDLAVEILAYLRGYSDDEVREWTEDETDTEHNPDLASDLAYLTSKLCDHRSVIP